MSDRVIRKKALARPDRTVLVRTLVLLGVCGIAAFIVLAVRLYEVQIVKHDYYESQALRQQLKQATITASRGTIYDVNGKILAKSATAHTVFVSPAEMNSRKEDPALIARGLSELLGVNQEAVLKRLESSKSQYEVIKRKLEDEDTENVRLFIKEHNLQSIHLEVDSKRYYPYSSLASQLIGFVGIDNNGLEGLENRYDKYLTGVNGRVVRLKNGIGTDMLYTDYEDYYDAQNGNDITLTLDAMIQYYMEKHLTQAIEDYDVLKGAACIAMRPKTGEILGMVSLNNYDPNNYNAVSEKELEKLAEITDEEEYTKALNNARFNQWRNKALLDTYEPGSVFKIMTLAMGLEEGVITPNDSFFCTGAMTFPGRDESNPLHCWRTLGHGTQNLTEAMMNSCNVALTNIGFKIGSRAFYKYVDAFGLFDKTGFELGEAGSIWWKADDFIKWTEVENNFSTLAVASFGQTFNITPIQMITAVAATINGGNLMQPYVVKQVTASDGTVVEVNEPTVVRSAISKGTSEMVRDILVKVVEEGTGKHAQVQGYRGRVGGKTGTSEKVVEIASSEEGQPKDYIVSFCGFAPADDPEVIILLLLDSPSSETGIYISGGVMAAPVVGNMLADILPYLGVAPQYTEEELKDLNVAIPKLVSKSVEDAKEAVKKQGLEYKIVGDGGEVTAQLPAANATVASGTTVIIYTEGAAPTQMVVMPNLSGMSYNAAKEALENRGLFIKTSGASKSDRKAKVSIQSVAANLDTTFGSVIEVTLIDGDAVELH